MKLGLILDNYSLRYDVRKVIDLLNEKTDLTIYMSTNHTEMSSEITSKYNIEFFQPLAQKPRGKIWTKLYKVFGVLPNDKKYFIDYGKRSFQNKESRKLFVYINSLRINVFARMPKFISYDKYLNSLGGLIGMNSMENQDVFLSFTGNVEESIVSQVHKLSKRHY
jgi:hypothetical protein